MGNLVVVLSVLPLLTAQEISNSSGLNVFMNYLVPISCVLAIIGAVWTGFADVLIECVKGGGLRSTLRKHINR